MPVYHVAIRLATDDPEEFLAAVAVLREHRLMPRLEPTETPGAPTSLTLPGVTGTAGVGATLTASGGTWDSADTVVREWLVESTSTGNATTTLALTPADYGKRVRVRETATNSDGSTTVYSAWTSPVAGVAAAITAAEVSGEVEVGETLTATFTATGTPTPTVAFQWTRDAAPIPGATAATYVVSVDDFDADLAVSITATNAAGPPAVEIVPAGESVGGSAPTSPSLPTVSGVARVLETLTCDPKVWSGIPTPLLSYQWYRAPSTAISGAGSATYTLAAADYNQQVFCRVTASNGTVVSKDSAPTAAVAGIPPANLTLPSVSGTPEVGATLTAAIGGWSGAPAPTFTYQWLGGSAGTTPIFGANGATYTPLTGDAGSRIAVRITATSAIGSSQATSAPTAVVQAVDVPWTPAATPALVGWWDVSDPARYNATTRVWTSRFGDKVLTAPGAGPTKATGGFGGAFNVLRFSGAANTGLRYTAGGVGEFISVLVFRFTNRSEHAALVNRPDLSLAWLFGFNSGGLRASYLGGDADDYTTNTNNPTLAIGLHSKDSRIVRANGQQRAIAGADTSGAENSSSSIDLFRHIGSSQAWDAEAVAFGLIHASGWSDDLAQRIEGFVAHAGLGLGTSVLPSDHPYKSSPPLVAGGSGDPSSPITARPTIAASGVSGPEAFAIGVTLTRTVAQAVPGWAPFQGRWFTSAGGAEIGSAASLTTNSSMVSEGQSVIYREWFRNATTGEEVTTDSLPYGPMTAAVAPPSGSQGSITDILIRSMFRPNHNGWLLNVNGNQSNDSNGLNHGFGQHWGYATKAIRTADRSAPGSNHHANGYGGSLQAEQSSSAEVLLQGWYVVMDAAQAGNNAPNTRAQFRNGRVWGLLMSGVWVPWTHDTVMQAGNWYSSFSSPGAEPFEPPSSDPSTVYGRRSEASNGGGHSIGGIGYGSRGAWAYHGYITSPGTRTVASWISDVRETMVTLEARTILHNPAGADDRANANLLVWPGADYYRYPGRVYLGESYHGSLDIITPNWKLFTCTGLPLSIINSNPPSAMPLP